MEHALVARHQQVVTPGDGVAQRPLTSGQIACTADQQRQAMFQALEKQAQRQHLRARGCQLNRQG
jgi:hypothetical protein